MVRRGIGSFKKAEEDKKGKKKKKRERERQHILMWLSHAMHTAGTVGRGKDKKESSVLRVAAKTLEKHCSHCFSCLQFFLSFPIQGGKMVH